MKILMVDDSRMIRKIIRQTLTENGYAAGDILEAGDGMEALRILREEPAGIDLLLLDWNMPRLDGMGFLRELRALAGIREAAVIMVTSQAQPASVAEAARLGVRDYIVKPFTPQTLAEKVRKVRERLESERSHDTSILLRAVAAASRPDPDRPFLAQVPPDVLEEFESLSQRRSYPAGAVLLLPHQTAYSLHILVAGEVEITGTGPQATVEKRGVGEPYGEQSLISAEPGRILVRALTPVEVLSFARLHLGEIVRRRPRMTYYLAGLISRRPVEPAPAAAPAAAGLAGRLEAVPIPDLVQILHMCRKTGHLGLTRDDQRAGLYVEDGELRHAYDGGVTGEEAFHAVMTWTHATFVFESGRRCESPTLTQPTMSLLLEGMRRLDEGRREGLSASSGEKIHDASI